MKRLIAILMTAVIAAAFTACAGSDKASDTSSTEAPTEQQYIATPIDEPEWTYAEGYLKLESGDGAVAEGSRDIICFAIVGADKESMELRFLMSDDAAAKLKEQPADAEYHIIFNDKMIGRATLSDDCKIASVTAADAQGDITELATEIRGVG